MILLRNSFCCGCCTSHDLECEETRDWLRFDPIRSGAHCMLDNEQVSWNTSWNNVPLRTSTAIRVYPSEFYLFCAYFTCHEHKWEDWSGRQVTGSKGEPERMYSQQEVRLVCRSSISSIQWENPEKILWEGFDFDFWFWLVISIFNFFLGFYDINKLKNSNKSK